VIYLKVILFLYFVLLIELDIYLYFLTVTVWNKGHFVGCFCIASFVWRGFYGHVRRVKYSMTCISETSLPFVHVFAILLACQMSYVMDCWNQVFTHEWCQNVVLGHTWIRLICSKELIICNSSDIILYRLLTLAWALNSC